MRAALRTSPLLAAALAALTLAGCGERGADQAAGTPRHPEAARAACITHTLAQQALDDLAMLEELAGAAGVGRAAYEYSRAYLQLAMLHAGAAAYADSAVNHAAAPADSARYAERARAFEISVPEPGTLEANVTDTYARRYAEIRRDADHPCNWNI